MGGAGGNTIDYITIASLGVADDFGDLTAGRYFLAATSDGSRVFLAGGNVSSNTIDYITIATTGQRYRLW